MKDVTTAFSGMFGLTMMDTTDQPLNKNAPIVVQSLAKILA